jgi:phospholipid/cholesterol/gamma-HCH transport system permease protein
MLLLTYPINQIFLTRNWRTCLFAGRFSENLSGGPLNLKNSFVNAFTWESLFIVGRRYWIHHWFGFTLQSRPTLLEFGAVSWMPSMVSISIIREIGPYYRFDLCWAHWFRYRCWTRIHAYTEQIDAMEVLALIRSNT